MFLTSYSIHVLHQIKLLFSSTSTGEHIVELQAISLKILVVSLIVKVTEIPFFQAIYSRFDITPGPKSTKVTKISKVVL